MPAGDTVGIPAGFVPKIEILCTVLHEAHERQVEEAMETLEEEPEGFHKSYLD